MKKNIYRILFLSTLVLLLLSCSVSKDKWPNRKYHAITAKYNALWNGQQALKEGRRTMEQAWKDDYTRIIPVYVNGNEEQANAIKANAERGIEKGSKVIRLHSMRFSGVEKNTQVDNAYLLIGQSCYYAHDYRAAEASFQYVISNWKGMKEIYEPMLWLALTYCKEKKHTEADIVLKQVKKAIDEGKAPKKFRKMMHLVWAENDIAQGKTLPALQNLQLRKKSFFEPKLNTRTKFIEGQIYMNNMQYAQATKCFKYTARHASDYPMQFVSKLNIALCFDPAKKNSISIIEDLEDMLDEKKNEPYLDQIYYAIGEVYFRNRSLNIACTKWEESVKYSKNNKVQKMASSLRAANVYYDSIQNYVKAKTYYDTALYLMDKDYPGRENIRDRYTVLSTLVDNLNTIQRWDSLLALSELSQQELDAKINKWIDDYKLEQKKKAEQERVRRAMEARANSINNYNQMNNRNGDNFYFNNPNTVENGKLEFKRKWGDRELADLWRLADQQEIGSQDEENNEEGAEGDSTLTDSEGKEHNKIQDPGYTPDMKQYYTKDIPYTQGAKDTANEEIANALLEAGYIFFQGINNIPKAIESFLELHRRYPEHRNVLPSSYHLYRLYDETGNYPSSNFYKNKILNEYPQSEYAAMIKNPDYLKEMVKSNSMAEEQYAKTYKFYNNNEYLATIEQGQKAIDTIKVGDYIPRIRFLMALSKGRLYGADSLADALNLIIFNYPNSEVTPIIERQLHYLSENYNIKDFDIKYDPSKRVQSLVENGLQEKDSTQVQDSLEVKPQVDKQDILDAESLVYRSKDMQHYYLIFFDDSKIDVSYMQQIIERFDKTNYPNKNLQSTSQLFTLSDQMINVRKFDNRDEAMEYYEKLENDPEFGKLSKTYYRHCIISIQNYSTLYNRRNIDAYMKFFRLMYLKDKENQQQ